MTNKTSKIVEVLRNSIKDIMDVDTKNSTAGGTSDARHFGCFGIETVEFGVINDTIHAINENTTTNEVVKLKDIFVNVIKRY